MSKVDLHLHSDYSDGSDSVAKLSEEIKKAEIKIFALTDHDTTAGCLEMQNYMKDSGITFIKGIELTCKEQTVKCHILGFNCDINNDTLKELILKGKTLRRIKLDTRVKYLKDVWNIELTKEERDWLYSRHSIVKTHIANVLVKRNLAKDNLSAMKKYLDGCKAGDTRFGGAEAINAIKASGGIPIWAHPLGGEGETHIAPNEFYKRFEILKAAGIQGLECHYSRYSKDEIQFLLDFAKENNLLISGGSDYHGSNKDIPLAKLNKENTYVDSSELTILKKIL